MKTDVESLPVNGVSNIFGESDNSFQMVVEHFINFLCYLNVIDAVWHTSKLYLYNCILFNTFLTKFLKI